jgi:two-component system, cell cycle response regulator
VPARVLIVDDEQHVLATLEELLRNIDYQSDSVEDGETALEYLRTHTCDVAVIDIRMPGMDGMVLLREIKSNWPEIDVIMMTAFDAEYSYMDVIEGGATDFIVKPFHTDELHAKMTRIERERRLRTELLQLSIRDVLTGLFNRRHLYHRLKEETTRAHRQGHPLSLIILDVDNFKRYNDKNGHLEGDSVLSLLGEIVRSSVREDVDSAYRYGGDEFAILLIETAMPQAARVAERVRAAFESREIDGCTLSLGIAELGPDGDIEGLLRAADEAMYRAKRAGGNRVYEISGSRPD